MMHVVSLRSSISHESAQLHLVSTHLNCSIVDLTTINTLTQIFYNPLGSSDQNECVYTFPLYESSAITSFTARINTRTTTGIAQEKAQDKKIFEAAKAEGKSAALLEDNADDVWTTSVGNVPAGAVVAIVLNMGFRLRRSI